LSYFFDIQLSDLPMTISEGQLATFDLNLLLIFAALFDEQNVTRAARRLGKSQPATSEALGRLRIAFDDQLFVRRGNNMVPTPKARQLEPVVKATLENAGKLLVQAREFDPAKADGEVRICMTEYCSAILLPALYDLLRDCAPNVTLWSTPSYRQSIDAGLRNSSFDVAIGALATSSPDFRGSELFHERTVCLLDKRHSAIKRAKNGKLRRDDLVSSPHVKVSIYRDRDSLVDDGLHVAGLEIPSEITVGQYLLVPRLLKNRNLLYLCGENFARLLAPQHQLAILELPIRMPGVSIRQVWHRRTDADPLLAWLRGQITDLAEKVIRKSSKY
jgi:DNA-binding transcriptional LysR family regulator